jgi:hypothetical protein
MCEETVMASIEQSARPVAAKRGQTRATQRLTSGARWVGSFLGESGPESDSSLRPEDVARSEVFYRSTGCWI